MLDPAVLQSVRERCLELPEAVEGGGVGDPSFRVRDRIFAMQHGHHGRPSLWCKAPPGAQAAFVQGEPQRFFVPPYVGQHGWVGMWLDVAIDWNDATELIVESYRMTAPKRLVRELDAPDAPP